MKCKIGDEKNEKEDKFESPQNSNMIPNHA